jgi:hypothetical protein
MSGVDVYRIAARVAGIRTGSALDPVQRYVTDVFDPMQKALSTLLPVLERIRSDLDSLKGKDEEVDDLLHKYLADTDLNLVKDGLTRYKWRDTIQFMTKLTLTLKEVEAPLEKMADLSRA